MVGIRNSAYDEYTDEERVTVGGIAPLSAQTKIGHTELFCTCSSTPWVSRNNFSFMLSDRVIVSGRFVSNSSHPRPPVTLPHLSVFFFWFIQLACDLGMKIHTPGFLSTATSGHVVAPPAIHPGLSQPVQLSMVARGTGYLSRWAIVFVRIMGVRR